jgi:hypothetical protein
MNHENKNPLLGLYFHEEAEKTEKKIRKHVLTCQSCQDYLQTLEKTGQFLKSWPDEKPDPQSFERILARIPERRKKMKPRADSFSFLPVAGIASAIAFIVLVLRLVQPAITRLPLWEALQKSWLVQAIGSFGVSIALFFALGTFAVLSLAPFFYLSTQKSK